MGKIYIISLILLICFCLTDDKNHEVFEVSSENKETKSVLDIKKFLECAKTIKDFPEYSNFIKVLEHKKGYKKQYDYIKRILPHNKEASLCKKSARKTIPKYLDEEKFAL